MTAFDQPRLVSVGPREYLDRLLVEYGLTPAAVAGKVKSREVPTGSVVDSVPRTTTDYLVHASLLRSHGDYPCAGDAEALSFCRETADEMVRAYGISQAEAQARVNRQWSEPDDDRLTPRVWIVGLDLVYHEDPKYWAGFIYFGGQGRWWDSTERPEPLPPPP